MDKDICHVEGKKRVAMIILLFHNRWGGEDEGAIKNIGQSWREVNQRVLQTSPCTVALLVVNCGFREWSQAAMPKKVCLLFTGGPDDHKVLELGTRMAHHPAIRLAMVRFISHGEANDHRASYSLPASSPNLAMQKELDEVVIEEFKVKWNGTVEYIEMDARNITEEVLTVGKAKDYELIIVGKGQQHLAPTMLEKMKDYQADHAELGPIGDILSSSRDIMSSVLILQAKDSANSNGTTSQKIDREKSTTIGIESSV
ncbi:hypothetical protein L6164_033543 [Bauhinia variegata]|nr:hypothetical protein L6164_033543 [Bauhinia variegata]